MNTLIFPLQGEIIKSNPQYITCMQRKVEIKQNLYKSGTVKVSKLEGCVYSRWQYYRDVGIDQLWKRCVGRVLCDQEGEFGDRERCRMQISMGRSRIEAEDRFVIWSRI